MHIVQTISGEYSDYQINNTYVGLVDPLPILNNLVQTSSDEWRNWSEMEKWSTTKSYGTIFIIDTAKEDRLQKLKKSIKELAVQELVKNGYVKIDPFEIWIED